MMEFRMRHGNMGRGNKIGMGNMWESMKRGGMAGSMERRSDSFNCKEGGGRKSRRIQRINYYTIIMYKIYTAVLVERLREKIEGKKLLRESGWI